jgi:hypothetical protein
VITGFNTDVEHDGVVYHVQTEDKGLDSPLILSLVYVGGAILASKRSPYEDLIAAGFSDEALSERLKRQHRLICAAIHSGRLNELKKMSSREMVTSVSEGGQAPQFAQVEESEIDTTLTDEVTITGPGIRPEDSGPAVAARSSEKSAVANDLTSPTMGESAHDPVGQSHAGQEAKAGEGLVLDLLDEQEFCSGDAPTLRVRVSKRSGEDKKPLGNVVVSVKILGTTFRPLIFSLKTQRDGTAEVSTEIPHFTSGRAAVLIRAVAMGSAAELRRVIHPSK